MHLLWFITIATLSFQHWSLISCNDLAIGGSSSSSGSSAIGGANKNQNGNGNLIGAGHGGVGVHQMVSALSSGNSNSNNNMVINSSLSSSGSGSGSNSKHGVDVFGSSGMSLGNPLNLGATGGMGSNTLGTMPMTNGDNGIGGGGGGGVGASADGVGGDSIGLSGGMPHHGNGGAVYGHTLAGLSNLRFNGLGIKGNGGGGGGGNGGGIVGSRLHAAMSSGGGSSSSTGILGGNGDIGGGGVGGGGSSSSSGGGFDGGGGGGGFMDSSYDRSIGGQNPYYEHFISEHTVMAVFTSQGQVGGPCRYMPATRRQNHQCRKEYGLPDTIREARHLATTHCEDQFRYDRWNCSIETRGKRNIFKKLYKETAFVHALTAAALTHSISRACAEGRMTKCTCGSRKKDRVGQDFKWGGCNDNMKHGKRVTRSFLDLRNDGGDEVTEILRHDSEVGIEAVSKKMKDKCKCHGVSGSCSMKTCWKKMSNFNETSALLRQKYNQAIRKAPNTRAMRRDASSGRMKRPKQRQKQQLSQYTTLYYLETSPTYCSVTKDRQCLHPDNCSNLCCGRGYTTRVFKQLDKCRCRFNNGRCCQLICDYCQRYEDRYFCK